MTSLATDIQTNSASVLAGLNTYITANMEADTAYATEFRNEIIPLSPYGMGFVEVTMNGATTAWGGRIQAEVPRFADAVVEAYLHTEMPVLARDTVTHVFGDFDVFYTNHTAAAILGQVSFMIGGTPVDTFTGHYVDALSELRPDVGKEPEEASMKGNDQATMVQWSSVTRDLWTKMPTAHSEFAGNALPTVAMHFSRPIYDIQLQAQNTFCAWSWIS